MDLQAAARQFVLCGPQPHFSKYVFTVKITQEFRRLGIPHAAHDPAHNNASGPLPLKGWTPVG
jgi:hypothetical protein